MPAAAAHPAAARRAAGAGAAGAARRAGRLTGAARARGLTPSTDRRPTAGAGAASSPASMPSASSPGTGQQQPEQRAACHQLVEGADVGDPAVRPAPRSGRPAPGWSGGARSAAWCGPAISWRRVARISASTRGSTALVASSSSTIRGSVQQRPGQRDPLPLAAGQGQAALADHGVVAVGQLGDEAGRLGRLRRRRRPARGRRPDGRRRCWRAIVSENRKLSSKTIADARRAASASRRSRTSTPPTRTRAGVHVVEARHQHRQGRLARAGAADDGHRLARARRSGRRPRSTGSDAGVAEPDVVEVAAPSGPSGSGDGVGRVDDLGRGVDRPPAPARRRPGPAGRWSAAR